MKFIRFVHAGSTHAGVLNGNLVHPMPPGRTLHDLFALGLPALLAAGEQAQQGDGLPLDEVRTLSPVTPVAIRDYSVFEQHTEGMLMGFGRTVPEAHFDMPTFYFSNPYAVTGPDDDIPIAPGSELFDYEIELAAVIGPVGRDLSVEQAQDHIIGYTLFNDWSARDLAEAELKNMLGPAKAKDTASTFGPVLVTADEFEQLRDDEGFLDVLLSVSLNGEVLGEDTAAHMAWTFEELVSHASRGTEVRPGDIIGSGTCGSGCLAEMWARHGRDWHRSLQPGDVVTASASGGIGDLTNTIVAATPPQPLPHGRAGKASTAS